MTLVTVDLVKSLFQFQPSAFEFNLHPWSSVDKQCDIVTVFISAFNIYLMCNLKLISAPVFDFEKFKIETIPIIPDNMLFFSESLCFFENRSFAEDIQYLFKFFSSESNFVVLL